MAATSEIVRKPWGYEYLAYEDANVAVWYLHIRAGEGTSFHYHAKKDTMLRVLAGRVRINNEEHSAGTHVFPRGEVHRTLALEDAWVMEIETPSDKEDVVRLSDDYGRAGQPYEGKDKRAPINGYEFPSREFP